MKILQVIPRYAPAWAFGGGVKIAFDLAREWVRLGHTVSVYTSDQLSNALRTGPDSERLDGIQVRRFPLAGGGIRQKIPILGFWPVGMAASIHATAGCHDVLHVAEARGIHVQWVHRAALRSSVPYVWAAYGGLARGTGLRRLYRRANDIILNTKRLIEGASCLVSQTDHESEVYKSFGARTEQIRQIPLCVDFAELAVPRSTGSFRQRMGIGPRTRIVLFLGRIHQTKGVDLLVDAFAIVASKSSACVLVIVGWDHGFKARLIRRIARLGLNGRVLFCDALFGQDRLAAYTDANVVAITPRVYEETSLAALEACACGTGVVVTKQCEIPGLEGAGVGRIVAAAARPIAEAIEELLSSDPTADVRERRERFVRLRFSSETVAQEYLRVFGESRCLADPAGR